MKPVCAPCQRFYRPSHNGRAFVEGMPSGNHVAPGKADPDNWRPYKLWMGDEWTCPDCGAVIIVGVGQGPISEHYQPDFAENVTRFGAELQVNDC
jgi:hypothetical protein